MNIGIFGGSFNPIHIGHALIAGHIIESGVVDRVWLMVSPQNPLKPQSSLANDLHRLRMTELVSRRLEGVTTSAFEMQLPRPSYTIDTLTALQEKFPDDNFHLIIGADNWALFDQWRESEKILSRFHVLIYPRLGYDVDIPATLADRVKLVDAPIIEISSTEIRRRLAVKQSITFHVPEAVEEYIHANNLYRDL